MNEVRKRYLTDTADGPTALIQTISAWGTDSTLQSRLLRDLCSSRRPRDKGACIRTYLTSWPCPARGALRIACATKKYREG